MGHILYGKVESTINKSDDDWYGVAAQVGKYTNTRAVRTDVTAVVSSTAGMGAPACFIPSLAEMHLNTEVVPLGDPDKVDFTDRLWMLAHAAAVGATTHEAAHARHTHFDPRDLMENYGASRKMIDVITTLEEPRIEAHAIRHHPESRVFLRGCAMEIVGRDFVIPDSPYGAAAAAGLLLARVDAKVLTRAEARGFRKDIQAVLGKDVLDTLEPLWQRFLRLHDDDYAGMVEVATEWLEALSEDPEDAEGMVAIMLMGEPLPGEGDGDSEGEGSGSGEGDAEGEGGSGSGEGEGSGDDKDGEGEGSGEGGEPKDGDSFGKMIKARVHITESKMDGEVVTARGAERAERAATERRTDAERRAAAEAEHADSFGKATTGLHGYTPDGFAHFSHKRPPTADERRAARLLAGQLEKIDYRDRAVKKVRSVVPPGRLVGRAAVQAEAYVDQGRDASGVEVWSGKRRTKVDSTPLTIGFLVDISGSMNAAMEPLGSTSWVVSNAGAHIDAKVATAHFGDEVHGVTPAGVREKEVRLFAPYDGSEAFRSAALAIDKELNLLDGSGARVLFVASDGVYVCGSDMNYARTWIPLARRKGVAVIYLNFLGSMGAGTAGSPVINCVGKSPAEVATLCGKAAIAEMRKMDARV